MSIGRFSLLIALLGGCSGVEVTSSQSSPVPATHEIGTQSVGELAAADADTPVAVFTKGPPALPRALRVIQLGMDASSARAAVELVRDPEVPLFESDAEGADLLGGQLPSGEGFGFTLIIRKSKVAEIDVSIPADGARERLVGLWGPGEDARIDGLDCILWRDGRAGVQARLFVSEDDKSVVKFSKQAN